MGTVGCLPQPHGGRRGPSSFPSTFQHPKVLFRQKGALPRACRSCCCLPPGEITLQIAMTADLWLLVMSGIEHLPDACSETFSISCSAGGFASRGGCRTSVIPRAWRGVSRCWFASLGRGEQLLPPCSWAGCSQLQSFHRFASSTCGS